VDFNDAFSLRGHRALVTGGGSGLGFAIAECFAAAGAEVVIAGRDQARLDTAAAAIGPTVRAIAFDVTDFAAASDFAARVEREAGPVSILVNNAGVTVKKPFAEMAVEDFVKVLNTHVVGAFALSRAFLAQVKQSGRGSILFTASMTTFLGIPLVIGYTAAKSAYGGMIRALATELATQGVRVNGVAPGWIDTPMYRQATDGDPARVAKIMSRIPMQRTGSTADIGWAMTYLASQAAAYVNGHILVVDGGALSGF
jgi:NAD(P)-dependent dehydrogenase (short-subunit alcohol dehydrogenase family)